MPITRTMEQLRARQVLRAAGLAPDVELRRVPTASNEVWLSPAHVIRIATGPRAARLRHEADVAALLPAGALHPGVVARGTLPWGEWTVSWRVGGTTLAAVWPTLGRADRRMAVHQLAGALTWYHRTPLTPEQRNRLTVATAADDPHPWAAVADLAAALQDRPDVDPVLVADALASIDDAAGALADGLGGLVHGDPHFDNVLWHQGRVVAVVDAEFARPTLLDADLDVLLRFCEAPSLHRADDGAGPTAHELQDVRAWLSEDLPHLFCSAGLDERLRALALAYDLRAWSALPVSPPGEPMASHHPARRITRLLGGRSPVPAW